MDAQQTETGVDGGDASGPAGPAPVSASPVVVPATGLDRLHNGPAVLAGPATGGEAGAAPRGGPAADAGVEPVQASAADAVAEPARVARVDAAGKPALAPSAGVGAEPAPAPTSQAGGELAPTAGRAEGGSAPLPAAGAEAGPAPRPGPRNPREADPALAQAPMGEDVPARPQASDRAPEEWGDLPAPWAGLCKRIGQGLGMVWLVLILMLLFGVTSSRGLDWPTALFVVMLPGYLLTLAVHEGGHWAVARWRGMVVLQVMIGTLELQPRRRGVRWRWVARGLSGGLGGWVQALPDPRRDIGRDLAWLAVGGAAANLAAAAVCACVAAWLGHSVGQAVALLWMLLHLALATVNLVPMLLPGPQFSDGLYVWHALRMRGGGPKPPHWSWGEVQWRLLHGEPASALPPALLRSLERAPWPLPACVDWLGCCAALERMDLEASQAATERLQQRVDEHHRRAAADPLAATAAAPAPPPGEAAPVQDEADGLLTLCRLSHAFASAVVRPQQRPQALSDLLGHVEFASQLWSEPQLAPRIRAMIAALLDDPVQARRWLAKSRRLSENSQFPAVAVNDAQVRAQVEAVLAERGAGRAPPQALRA